MNQSMGMMMVCIGVFLCLAGAQGRALRSMTGTVTVSAPPGAQTVIETTETRGGQTVQTSRQVVSGSTVVNLDGGNTRKQRGSGAPQSVSVTASSVKTTRVGSGGVGVTTVTTGNGVAAQSTAIASTNTPVVPVRPVAAAGTVVQPTSSGPTSGQSGPAPGGNPAPSAVPDPRPTVATGAATRQVLPAQDRVVDRRASAVGQNTRVDPQGQTVAQSVAPAGTIPLQSGVSVGSSDISG